MAKFYEKKLDSGTRNAITEQINVYIDSIKEDIGYDEFDKSLQKDAVIEQIMDYYAANPMDDTMSYDDWVNDFIDGNNLRNNSYKSQFKDYLRNLVAIIYSNISEVEYEPEKKEARAAAAPGQYKFSEYIHIADQATSYRMSIAQNDAVTHHLTNIPTSLGKAFKNRDMQLSRAEERLSAVGKLYLENANAGYGKRSFARELYHKVNPNYNHCAWIKLDSDLRQSILDSMSIYPATTDVDTRYSQITALLRAKKNKVVFFIDNTFGCNLTEEEFKFLVDLQVDTFFIDNPMVGNAEEFSLGVMPLDQCIDIFYEYYTLDKAHKFIDIIEEYIDLADRNLYLIKLLAKSAKGYNLADFLHRLRNDGFTQDPLSTLSEDDASLYIARNIIKLCKAANLTDEQYDILKYFAVLPDVDIPGYLISELDFSKDDMSVLINLGMIDCYEKTTYGTSYNIHPLMRKTMNIQFDIEPEECRPLFALIINGKYIKGDDNFASFMKKLKIAYGVLDRFKRDRFEEKGELFNAIACWFYICGEYQKSMELCSKAVNIRDKIPVVNHPATAVVYDNYSIIHTTLGSYDEAVTYGEKALEIYDVYRDAYISNIAGVCATLGDAYSEKGEYEKAIEYYTRALETRQKGAQTVNLAELYSKLGTLYNEMKEPEKAIDYHTKSLKIKEKLLGIDNPMTAATYNSLALIYKEQGDFEKALDYNNKTLKIRLRVLGEEHPLTARTYNHLGRIYLNKQEYNRALDYYVKAYKIVKHIYGDSHPQTRLILENLETSYRRSFEKWLGEQLK